MTAAHFFAESVDGDTVSITGDEARHAARVLRIGIGEEITVSDGAGKVVRARTISATASRLTAEVLSRDFFEPPVPYVIVYPAVPKAGKLETIVQKLTEIGVDEIRPWVASRTVVRWDERKTQAHAARLVHLAHESAKQSRRARLPIIGAPGPLDLELPSVVLHEEAGSRLRDVLPAEQPLRFGLVVGPEGGLEASELASIGAPAARLGREILRTETAAVVGAALVLQHFGRLG